MPAIGLLACAATGLPLGDRGLSGHEVGTYGHSKAHSTAPRTDAQTTQASGEVYAAATTTVCVATDTDMAELVVAGGGAADRSPNERAADPA